MKYLRMTLEIVLLVSIVSIAAVGSQVPVGYKIGDMDSSNTYTFYCDEVKLANVHKVEHNSLGPVSVSNNSSTITYRRKEDGVVVTITNKPCYLPHINGITEEITVFDFLIEKIRS